MFKQIIYLWKNEGKKTKTALHRRLLLFFVLISISLILAFALLLSFFGITGKQDRAVENHLNTELSNISTKIDEDFGRISLEGIAIAEDLIAQSEHFFAENNISASELASYPALIKPLLDVQIQTLIDSANAISCGGVFVMLDATINPDSNVADTSKAGIFLKKTQPTSTSIVDAELYCLRGPAQTARQHGVMLMGQWQMEYDITNQDFFKDVIQTAQEHPQLPLSRLYYWSGRVMLKNNSESGFLLCVPLRCSDGTVFGLCGIEISDRMFKSLYSPENGDYENIFTIMAPASNNELYTSKGLLAGNSYLTGTRWDFNLTAIEKHEDFIHYAGNNDLYGGKTINLRMYSGNSPYINEIWTVSVLMPHSILHDAVTGSAWIFRIIVIILLITSFLLSLFVSHRFLKPVHEELTRLHDEKTIAQTQYEQAQTYITHLSQERMPEVNEADFHMFLSQLDTLTPKEREIFELYYSGKGTKEILTICNINQNTLKYHNKNIYSKLGVTSRKQLLEYATLLKYMNI